MPFSEDRRMLEETRPAGRHGHRFSVWRHSPSENRAWCEQVELQLLEGAPRCQLAWHEGRSGKSRRIFGYRALAASDRVRRLSPMRADIDGLTPPRQGTPRRVSRPMAGI